MITNTELFFNSVKLCVFSVSLCAIAMSQSYSKKTLSCTKNFCVHNLIYYPAHQNNSFTPVCSFQDSPVSCPSINFNL